MSDTNTALIQLWDKDGNCLGTIEPEKAEDN